LGRVGEIGVRLPISIDNTPYLQGVGTIRSGAVRMTVKGKWASRTGAVTYFRELVERDLQLNRMGAVERNLYRSFGYIRSLLAVKGE
jgi:hypothetical protein